MNNKILKAFLAYHDKATTNGSVYNMKLESFTAGYEAASNEVSSNEVDQEELQSYIKRLEAANAEIAELKQKLDVIETITESVDQEEE